MYKRAIKEPSSVSFIRHVNTDNSMLSVLWSDRSGHCLYSSNLLKKKKKTKHWSGKSFGCWMHWMLSVAKEEANTTKQKNTNHQSTNQVEERECVICVTSSMCRGSCSLHPDNMSQHLLYSGSPEISMKIHH